MSAPKAEITIPEVVERFALYHQRNAAWGSLHIVLDDNNIDDSSVEFCAGYAQDDKDTEGEELAEILLKMSKSQRLRLPGKVDEFMKLADMDFIFE